MRSSPLWNTGTISPESGWENSEVLHTVKIDMVKLVVDVENSYKSADEIDKETVSFGEMQLKLEDWSCVHASDELHLHVVHVIPMSMNLINIGSMQVFDQFNISNEFTSFSRKSIQKLGIDLKLLQCYLVNVHIIE
ncbi:hypothetical protein Tco_0709581 [Tanacetum coccineum]